jgi:hypothetical protein
MGEQTRVNKQELKVSMIWKKKINKMQIKIVLAGKSLLYGTIKKLTFVAKL